MSTYVSDLFCSPSALQGQYKVRTSSRLRHTSEVAASGHHDQLGERTGVTRRDSNAHLTRLPTVAQVLLVCIWRAPAKLHSAFDSYNFSATTYNRSYAPGPETVIQINVSRDKNVSIHKPTYSNLES